MNSQHIVDSIINRDYNEAEQTMFESLTQKLNDKIIESKYEVANQFREEMEGGSGYDAFFKKAMKKFGISSPADLKTDEKKKEFFDYIDKNFAAKNEGYGGMAKMRRGGSEEEFRFPFGKNPYRPVSTPDDRPPYDPRPVGGRDINDPKITRDPLRPNFPGIEGEQVPLRPSKIPGINDPVDPNDPSVPIGPGGKPGGYPGPKITRDPYPDFLNRRRPVSTPDDRPVGGRDINDPKITQDPLRPNFPGIEGEMPEMGAEMMGMDKKKKMGKESGDLESAIKKALDVAGKEQAQAPQAQGGMPGMGGGGQNPMAAMAKMMGGGMKPPMGGGQMPPMGGGQMPPMGGGMKPPMGGMKRRKMGGGM